MRQRVAASTPFETKATTVEKMFAVFRGSEGAEARVGDDLTAPEAVALMEKVFAMEGTNYVFAQHTTREGFIRTISLANMRAEAQVATK